MSGASTSRLLDQISGELDAGENGVIVARAGIGKSTLLVRIATDHLRGGERVFHVTLHEDVERVRLHYDEVLRSAHVSAFERSDLERRRMIHSYARRDFDVGNLDSTLRMLTDVADFKPDLIVVDGFDAKGWRAHLDGLYRLAEEFPVLLWSTVRDGEGWRHDAHPWALCPLVVQLTPEDRDVRVSLHREEGSTTLPVSLDPSTMAAKPVSMMTPEVGRPRPVARECTLYSGGAGGAEAAFGEAADYWSVVEVAFTFDGHRQVRTQGRYVLGPDELQTGDVSLVYVSRRLNRDFHEDSLIRKVLQTLWHMVSRSEQIFVVGQIQDDGTVIGGTGWSVELAKMWNKALWVFDQDKEAWFRWENSAWTADLPSIVAPHICGTGTRYLTDGGRAAIRELFVRSFGTAQ